MVPVGEKEGPRPEAWEDEGEPVHQWRDLIPLTLPSRAAMGPALAPMGRGKVFHRQSGSGHLYTNKLHRGRVEVKSMGQTIPAVATPVTGRSAAFALR
jgi:hypothetical protein